jgi:hypothetical protein
MSCGQYTEEVNLSEMARLQEQVAVRVGTGMVGCDRVLCCDRAYFLSVADESVLRH